MAAPAACSAAWAVAAAVSAAIFAASSAAFFAALAASSAAFFAALKLNPKGILYLDQAFLQTLSVFCLSRDDSFERYQD